ncbi:hypothetical protein GCM10010492_16230 [Saccharothrix mutabilis subsp. mutabilis]|uniref:Uncharacterized protein n=1 Tax=Saccharothrix mutabilis subsp. mutabilis TaxID=66855 RepID=A0ABN0TDN9_9PSEU
MDFDAVRELLMRCGEEYLIIGEGVVAGMWGMLRARRACSTARFVAAAVGALAGAVLSLVMIRDRKPAAVPEEVPVAA